MCGISGIFRFNNLVVDESEILEINDKISHRGMDSYKVITSKSSISTSHLYPGLALGHRRLSIIDLSANAIQPMTNNDNSIWIVYNGELYNFLDLRKELSDLGYNFRSNSDTEVVLASYQIWKEDCVNHLNGMFAFAIWDNNSENIFCARDHIGIKPFYYFINDQEFKFSSESQALISKGEKRLNLDSVRAYFLGMYVPSNMSIYDGIVKLLPGHTLTIDKKGKSTFRKFWDTPVRRDYNIKSVEEAASFIAPILTNSIKMQLVSDVPVGAFLSGGFDSGLLVSEASKYTNNLHTYSIGFDDNKQPNELEIAKAISNKYGTEHHAHVIRTGEIIHLLDSAISNLSEPISDSAIVPTYYLAKAASSDGVKVLLSGTGGDEIFAGYERYIGYSKARKLFLATPPFIRKVLANFFSNDPIFASRLKHTSIDMLLSQGGSPEIFKKLFPNQNELRYFLENLALRIFPDIKNNLPELQQQMSFDLQVYLPDMLLLLLDQLTMASTVEGRVPYLDISLVKANLSINPQFHCNGKETKIVQKLIAKGKIDERTYSASKQGFSGPVPHWIENNFDHFKEQVFALKKIDIFSDYNFELVFKSNSSQLGYKDYYDIFSLYCFSLWYDKHFK